MGTLEYVGYEHQILLSKIIYNNLIDLLLLYSNCLDARKEFPNLRDLSMESTRDEASSYLNGPFFGNNTKRKRKPSKSLLKLKGKKKERNIV